MSPSSKAFANVWVKITSTDLWCCSVVKHLSSTHSASGSMVLYPALKYSCTASSKQACLPVCFQSPASFSCSHSILVVGMAGYISCICATVARRPRGKEIYFSSQFQGFSSHRQEEAWYGRSHSGSECVVALSYHSRAGIREHNMSRGPALIFKNLLLPCPFLSARTSLLRVHSLLKQGLLQF